MSEHLNILRDELKNRARIYVCIYRELAQEVGKEKAVEILKRALYARGQEKGRQLAIKLGKPNLRQLAASFVEGKEDMDAFGHEVVEEQSDFVVLRLNMCPLVDVWREGDLSAEEQKILCDIAYQVDFGKFEAAGYKLSFDCRIADGCKSCDLRVKI
jgi:hypothetical protein